MPPRLAPGTPMQARNAGAGERGEARTLTRTEPRRPVSSWHTVRWWRLHHMDRTGGGEWRDDSGWAGQRAAPPVRRRIGNSRAQLREDVRLAQHAQDLRAEAATMGGREETQRFYGRGEYGVSGGGTERRITTSRADADRAAYEAEQADRYSGRRRARGTAAMARYREQLRGATT